MSSVYALTFDGRVVGWSVPVGKSAWIQKYNTELWKVYYYTCRCADCKNEDHKALVTWVQASTIRSIGFERPAGVEGRLVTWQEKNALTDVIAWIRNRKRVPAKLTRVANQLETLLKLCEK